MSQSQPNVIPTYQVCNLAGQALGTAICLSERCRIKIDRLSPFDLGRLEYNVDRRSFVWEALHASNPHLGEVAWPLAQREWLSKHFNPQDGVVPTCVRIEPVTHFEVIDPQGGSLSRISGSVALFLRAGLAGTGAGWFSVDATGSVKAGNGQSCQPPQKAGRSHRRPPAGGSYHLLGGSKTGRLETNIRTATS